MTRLRRLVGGAGAAVLAQGLTALTSLLVQVLAARQLGAAGYGTFVLVQGVLLVVLAAQNGWVGDSLTVLDRWDPQTRSALTVSLLAFVAVGAGACAGTSLLLGSGGAAGAFALMAVAYLLGELCRRVFMARREFGALTVNNGVLVLATWALLLLQTVGDRQGSLGGFALALAGGSAAAVAAAVVQLPRAELSPAPLSLRGLPALSRFAVWRSAQIGVRPLVLLGMRLIVSVVAGRAALGQVEAARLLMAPATTFTQGVGSFLLPLYAAEARGETGKRVRVGRVTAAVVGATLAMTAVPLLFPEQAGRLLTDGAFPLPYEAVAGWAVLTVAFALGLPSANQLVAHRRSRQVLLVRLVDGVLGLAAVVVLVVGGATYGVPFGLAVGALVGALLTVRLAARLSPTTSAPQPAAAR